MNWNTPPKPKKGQRRPVRGDRFLEALRGLGSGVVDSAAHDVVGGVAGEALNQLTGRPSRELSPQAPYPQEQVENKEKQQRYFQQEFLSLQSQERMVWKRAERDTQAQISAIVQELQQIAKTTEQLSQEVQVAVMQTPVEPGVYHVSFFEKLRQALVSFRKGLQQSATWLEAFNTKTKKRNYYWRQVKKSGTKFMLSQERYMATQAG